MMGMRITLSHGFLTVEKARHIAATDFAVIKVGTHFDNMTKLFVTVYYDPVEKFNTTFPYDSIRPFVNRETLIAILGNEI